MLDNIAEAVMDFVMPIIFIFCGIAICGLILAIPFIGWGAYKSFQSPTFELYKSEWRCDKHELRPSTSVAPIIGQNGGVAVVPSTERICVRYVRVN